MLIGLALCLLFTVQAELSAPQDKSVSSCTDQCTSKFKTACERGCAVAYALSTAPKSYSFNPTCVDSCKDAYPNSVEEANSCNFGCYAYVTRDEEPQFSTSYHKWFNSVSSYFRSLLDKLLGRPTPSPTTIPGSQLAPKLDDQSIVTRVRIFYIVRPDETEDSPNVLRPIDNDKPLSEHSGSQPDTKSELVARDGEQHQSVDHTLVTKRDWRIACLLRKVLSDPIRLLFFVTLIGLLVLLVAQFVLCIRRLRRHNRYNYVALPTYAEAVEVKLPLETNTEYYEGFTKEPKESDA